MMKYFLILVLGLVSLNTSAQKDTLTAKVLNPEALKDDFRFLRRILTETHPGLYRYASKERMNQKMDSIALLLNKPMAFYDFYLLLSDLISSILCAYIYLGPTKDLESYYVNQLKTFPFMM